MRAFLNDLKIKEKYLNRVKAHAKADEIIKGSYWEDGKGCAVGCTIHSADHEKYETELGIPVWLARVEDTLFENLPNSRAKVWPEQFLSAIKPGVDLEKVKNPFLILILEKNLKSMDACQYDKEKWPDVTKALDLSKSAIRQMIDALKNNDESAARSAESAARSAESAARSAARSAAWSAESAAWSAVWSAARSAESAVRSAAWSAARSAAWSAARSAESAARSAESAARSAARSAESAARSAADSAARSAESAARSAWSAAYEYFADELLKLLANCK